MTINKALSLLKAIRRRITELDTLRAKVSIKEIYYTSTNKTVEPNIFA